LKRRCLGFRAGSRQRERRKKFKPFHLKIIMSNVRSPADKMIELGAKTRMWRYYWKDSWIRGDCRQSGNCKGGGIATLVNNTWRNLVNKFLFISIFITLIHSAAI